MLHNLFLLGIIFLLTGFLMMIFAIPFTYSMYLIAKLNINVANNTNFKKLMLLILFLIIFIVSNIVSYIFVNSYSFIYGSITTLIYVRMLFKYKLVSKFIDYNFQRMLLDKHNNK